MKHASKLVVLLVVTALLLGLAGVAGAATFSDIEGKTGSSDIIKLNALGIINGYEDGSFKPDGNITRAEFAKISVIAAGMKDSADMLKNASSQFSDVQTGAWYTGWINLAASQGFLKGYPDGTFKPNDNITYAEVITVLMRVLGYNDNLPGDWPVDYLIKASVEGITKNIPVVANSLATRENVVRLSSKTLETTRVLWDKQTEQFNNTTDNKTLLAKYFDGNIVKNQVVYNWKYNSTKSVNEISFIDFTAGNESAFKALDKDAKIAGADDVSGLLDQYVDYLTNKDGDIVWIGVKDYGTVSTMSKDSAKYATRAAGSTQIKIYKTNYNLATTAIYDDGGLTLFAAAAKDFATGQRVTGVKDKDGNIAYVYVEDPGLPGIYDSYTAATKKATLKVKGDQPSTTIDLSKKDGNFRVVRNGAAASIENLQKGDLVVFATGDDLVVDDVHGYDVVVIASSNTVTGALEGADSTNLAVTVNGKQYKVAGAGAALPQLSTNDRKSYADYTAVSQLKDVFDKKANVTVTLDELGKAATIITSVGATVDNYAVVNKLFQQTVNGAPELTSIEMVLTDGTKATYSVDKASDWAAVVSGNLVKYSLKDNGKLDAPTVIATAGKIFDYNKDISRITLNDNANALVGTYFITDKTTVFDLKGGTSNTDIKVVSVADFKKGLEGHAPGAGTEVENIYVTKDNYIQYMVVGTATDVAYGDSGSKKGVVTAFSYTGKYYVTLNVKGTETQYEVNATNNVPIANYANIKKGDFVDFTLAAGKVSVLTITEAKATTVNDKVVEKIDAATSSFKLTGDANWYVINSDSVVYSVGGDTPAYVGYNDIVAGAEVVISGATNTKGGLTWVVIK